MSSYNTELKSPLFSIVIPTRNRAETFARAVSSVSRQTLTDFELIVVDDCSDTVYAYEVCQASGCDFVLIRNRVNLGVGESRNKGIAAARGEYISFLDDDDEYVVSFLQKTYDRLAGSPFSVGLSWCGSLHIDYPDVSVGESDYRKRIVDHRYESELELFECLMSIGTGFGVTVKASCLREIGIFDSKLTVVEDADFFLRLLSSGFVPTIVPGVHITIHNHRNVRLTSVAMHKQRIKECRYLLEQHTSFLEEMPTLRKQLKLQIQDLENQMEMQVICERA
jgi:glycosyltransferase involved in cell wall biosynthesis